MPRFAANISMMFNEVPFLDRFERAAKAGFKAVEFLFPYEFPAAEIALRLKDNGLQQVLFNGPPGDWTKGERGIAALPGRQAEFREGIKLALEYSTALGCPLLHVMAGLKPEGMPYDSMLATYAANLAWASREAAKVGVKPIIEPINHIDIPGFFLNTTDQGAAIIQGLGPDRVGLQFDLYHCAITQGDICRRVEKHLPLISHMQVADNPGRNEPGTGEVNWPFVFKRIDELGFQGWIGCEYRPAAATEAGLGWFQPYK